MPRKKLEIALLNKTDFKVKFKFEGKNCALEISAHQFLGWNIWQSSTRPSFLTFCSEIKKEIEIYFFSTSTNLCGIFGCDLNKGQGWNFHLKYFDVNKMRDKVPKFLWALRNIPGKFGCDQTEGQGWNFHLKYLDVNEIRGKVPKFLYSSRNWP